MCFESVDHLFFDLPFPFQLGGIKTIQKAPRKSERKQNPLKSTKPETNTKQTNKTKNKNKHAKTQKKNHKTTKNNLCSPRRRISSALKACCWNGYRSEAQPGSLRFCEAICEVEREKKSNHFFKKEQRTTCSPTNQAKKKLHYSCSFEETWKEILPISARVFEGFDPQPYGVQFENIFMEKAQTLGISRPFRVEVKMLFNILMRSYTPPTFFNILAHTLHGKKYRLLSR